MSQQMNNSMNYLKSDHNEIMKDQEPTERIKPFPNGSNTQQIGFPQRPPLTRVDSRNSFQVRPGFPYQQGVPLRPPGQPIRPPPSGATFPQRLPGIPNRPPFQLPFPNSQPIQNTQNLSQPRTVSQVVRHTVPIPNRSPVPGPRPPGIIQQRSESYSDDSRIDRSAFSRSQTLDSIDAEYTPSEVTSLGKTNISAMSIEKPKIGPSLNYMNSTSANLSEDIPIAISRNESIEEKRVISMSQESLDRKSENEYPSRPESRSGSRMHQISENNDDIKQFNRQSSGADITTPRPESKSSVNVKQSTPRPMNQPQEYSPGSNQKMNTSENKVNLPNVEEQRSSIQLKNLRQVKTPVRIEGDNDSGVDESTNGNDQSSNFDASSPRKSSAKSTNRISSATPSKSRSLSRDSKSPSLKSPDSTATTPGTVERKKLPMNKVQVGSAPSPNLKEVRSKIGSLQNTTYKPGGGNVKIENKKIELKNVTPRIEAKNDKYIPKGGEKKIISQKLQWNAKSKIGSLENANHKPVSSGKKIESVKLDFKDKAKPKVGSKDNMKHTPRGGDVKIENKKLEFNVQSKVGSLDNVKHKPKGGDKKIFDDKEYLKQRSAMSSENHSMSGSQNSLPSQPDTTRGADENLNQHH